MPVKKKYKPAPTWLTDYFTAAQERHEQLVAVLQVSAAGIKAMQGMPKIFDVLQKLEPEGQYAERKERAEKHAALAHAEAQDGFPTLNGFGVLALWSWLESFALDLVVLWVHRKPSCLKHAGGTKVRIELRDLVHLRGERRARYIVEQIDRDTSGPLRQGSGRFDGLLHSVGLCAQLSDDDRRALFEFQQVRNCLAHRFGFADHQLVSACPWLNLSVGDRVMVSQKMLMKYAVVGAHFLIETLYSATDSFKLDIRERVEADRKEKPKSSTRKKQGQTQVHEGSETG